jgi:hypothetical protein
MYSSSPDINVIVLIGLTITKFDNQNTDIFVETKEGRSFQFYHSQDCCESVGVHDIKGDLNNLIGTPILSVKEEINHDQNWPEDVSSEEVSCDDSWTWTTFTFTTAKGVVIVRWLGSSNGYYSESVSFIENK